MMGCGTAARDGSASNQGMRDSNRASPSTRLGRALTREMAMERHKSDAANGGKMADIDANEPADGFDELAEGQDELVATAATVAVAGAGVIIFEAGLLPGLVLGIATMPGPKYLTRLRGGGSPPFT